MALPRTCLVIAACVALSGCLPTPPAAPAPAPAQQLVTYSVEPALSPQVQGVLRRLLRPGSEDARGTISEAPGGHIAVLAPASVHEGVAAMIATLQAEAGEQAPPANLRFTYWLVQGSPVEEPVPLRAALAPLQETLAAVSRWDGVQDFKLVGHSTLTSLDSDRGASHSERLRVSQVASLDPATGHILADVDLELEREGARGPSPRLETRVQLQPGQTLVLSTLDAPGATQGTAGAPLPGGAHLYVVVRADLLPGG